MIRNIFTTLGVILVIASIAVSIVIGLKYYQLSGRVAMLEFKLSTYSNLRAEVNQVSKDNRHIMDTIDTIPMKYRTKKE
jgi:hypothetical protein